MSPTLDKESKFGLLGTFATAARQLYAGTSYSYQTNTNTGEFLSVDPTTAVTSLIGMIGYAVTGMSFDPTSGILYAVTSNLSTNPRSLITIDPVTGAGTLIGALGGGGQPVTDISFDSSGVLYGWSKTTEDLYTIDLSTGARTVVANSGLGSSSGGALDFDESGVLWFIFNGVSTSRRLRTIDKVTGLPTNQSFFSAGGGFAAGAGAVNYDDGLMYITMAAGSVSQAATVDLSNGTVSFIGATNTYTGPTGAAGGTRLEIDALAWSL